jgi:hypothetical protein
MLPINNEACANATYVAIEPVVCIRAPRKTSSTKAQAWLGLLVELFTLLGATSACKLLQS